MTQKEKLSNLAINGGPSTLTEELRPRYHFGKEEKAAADRLFDKAIAEGDAPGYGGEEEAAFCKEFSEMLGGGYADAVNSGTTSVYVALRALEIEPFTEVITPPITDPGGLMPVVMMNCIPVIADAAKDSFNMSLESVRARCTPNTSAILVAHIAGEPADIEGICAFAKERGIRVVEDVAQAHGATMNGRLCGTFGDTAGYSMMYGKHTCVGGQGGMVFTRDENLYWKIRQYSDRGKPFGLKSYDNVAATLNFNMDEIHCAIGREQIKKTFSIAAERRRIVKTIAEEISDIPCLYMPKQLPGADPSYWFMRIMWRDGYTACDKYAFCDALSAEGLPINPRYAATPYTADWYQYSRVFGTSGYPWCAPEYQGDRTKRYTLEDVPTAADSLDRTVILYARDGWTETNIRQVCEAFHKVYDAYRTE